MTIFAITLISFIGLSTHDAFATTTNYMVDTTITSDQTIASGDQWSVFPGVTLTISPGVTLTVQNGGSLYEYNPTGTITNEGTIAVNGAMTPNGIFNNHGILNINAGGSGGSGVITNALNSAINVNTGGDFEGSFTINNNLGSAITISSGGKLAINGGGFLYNDGTTTNNSGGDITMFAGSTIDNHPGGLINNDGSINIFAGGLITNSGVFNVECDGIFPFLALISGNTPVNTCLASINSLHPGQLSFSTSNGGITGIAQVNPGSLPLSPPLGGYGAYPYGFFSFNIKVPNGGSSTMTITYPGPVPPGSKYAKFGPSSSWMYITPSIIGNTMTMTLTDGGLGDADGSVNGVITDPGGLLALDQIGPPVGGSGIPIDSTALLLAGVQGSALWMIPAIVVAGAGIAIFSFKRSKKKHN